MFPAKKTIKKEDVQELYYVMSVHNLESVLKEGVLSRNLVQKHHLFNTEHDVSNPDVQALREREIISPYDKRKRKLHDYVNFYLQPHNAIMPAIQAKASANTLCILRISKRILNIPGAILTTKNAACHSVRFFKSTEWAMPFPLSEALSSPCLSGSSEPLDEPAYTESKQRRQSEALILDKVSPQYINGVFICHENNQRYVRSLLDANDRQDISITVHPSLFPASFAKQGYTCTLRPFTIPTIEKKIRTTQPTSSGLQTELHRSQR